MSDLSIGFVRWCGLSLFIGLFLAPPAAFAVDDEMIVTGSRIGREPGNYVGPMTVIDTESIEKLPTYSLGDALLRVPAIGKQGTNRNNSNGGRGAEFRDIHQLEPERTLVLRNGRRTVSTIRDTLGLAVDMQSFSVNTISNVEVLADGASAVYGSDAIAGVINIKTLEEFEGVSLTGGAGMPSDSGGDQYNAGALFGVTGSRGWITFGTTFTRSEDVDYQQRDWSRDPILGINDGQVIAGRVILFGSGIPPQGRQPDANIIFEPNPNTGESFQSYDTFCLGPQLDGSTGDGSLDCIKNQNHRFNYNLIETGSSLMNEGTNFNFSTTGEYEFENGVTGYVDAMFAHRDGHLNFTPLPIADAHGRFTDMIPVPFTNPNIPADALPVIQGAVAPGATQFQMWWRALDAGPRQFDYDGETYQTTLGFKGDFDLFSRNWSWDTWLTSGKSTLYEVTHDQINVARLRTAMDPVACAADADCPKVNADNAAQYPGLVIGDPTTNIFGRNSWSQAEKDWITFDDQEKTDYEMYHLAGTIVADLLEMDAGTLGFAGGLEWRREKGGVQVSGVVENGDSGGNFAESTDGDYNLWEAYGELSVPILSGAPFAEELGVDLALRHSDYDTFGSETTYKVALSWAPVESVRLRGVISTGFRAPNILELFGGGADNFLLVTDPCSAPITDPNVQANCTAAGVPPGYVQNASQLKVTQGGNPNLDAEESDNYSFGIVFTLLDDSLRVALDYYDVEVENAISTPEVTDVINNCYNSPNGSLSSPDCARIDRGPSGTVTRFDVLNENLNEVETSGIDMNATYSFDAGPGNVNISWLLNWLDEYTETNADGVVSDRSDQVAGAIADWSAYPEWRSNLGATYSQDAWSVNLNWRYVDEMDVFDALDFDNVNLKADSMNYFDLYGTYNLGAWDFMVGIDNLTDEEPPYVPDVSVNTSTAYDWLGRMYFARATVSFK